MEKAITLSEIVGLTKQLSLSPRMKSKKYFSIVRSIASLSQGVERVKMYIQ